MVTCWIFPSCLPGQESSSLASGCKLQGGACPGTPALLTSPYKSCSLQDSCLHSSAYYCCCFQPGQTHSIWRLEAVVLSKTANLKVAKDGWQAISSGLRYVRLRNLLNPMLLNSEQIIYFNTCIPKKMWHANCGSFLTSPSNIIQPNSWQLRGWRLAGDLQDHQRQSRRE